MKISREWLQTYFDKKLPEAQTLADALTFHAFEIESVEKFGFTKPKYEDVEDWVLDVKVTPNRGHDCLSHRGVAKELAAILKLPMKNDGLRKSIILEPKTDIVKVAIEDAKLCSRFTGAYIRGLKVGPSPEWLTKRLEAVGQKSINNVVDATNYVMFGFGQPLHAFDVGKLREKSGSYAMNIRLAKKGGKLMGLDDKEYELTSSMLVIEDANADEVVSIAGIKGGKPTGIDEKTTEVFLEAANWNGVTIRKTSQALRLRTDASERFQQVISPELAAYGTLIAAKLIVELAGGEIVGYVDEYPAPQEKKQVSISTDKVNKVLGTELSSVDIADTFTRLGFSYVGQGKTLTVNVPFERLDIEIPEDLVEEVARIVGYDKVPSAELPAFDKKPEVNPNFYAAEKVREDLMAKGYSEVYTSVFAEEGERAVLNKVGGEKPYLRTTLMAGLKEARERNERNKDVLGISDVKLVEIGAVWKDGKETVMLGIADSEGIRETPLEPVSASAYDDLPTSTLGRYQPFSRFPAIVRDISLWVPAGTFPNEAGSFIGEVLNKEVPRLWLHLGGDFLPFDTYEDKKAGRLSMAFRVIFQSFEKTLTDEEANAVMEKVYEAVKKQGWEVR